MNRLKLIAVGLLSATLVAGCAGTGPKEQAGAAAGAVAGAAMGWGLGKGHRDQTAAVVLGAFLGGILGQKIGQELDEADQIMAQNSVVHALEYNPTGISTNWRNPETGHSGYTVPVQTYYESDGTPCREYTTTVNVGGEEQSAYGTACRQADGSWKIVN